jgi:hypothetical protein
LSRLLIPRRNELVPLRESFKATAMDSPIIDEPNQRVLAADECEANDRLSSKGLPTQRARIIVADQCHAILQDKLTRGGRW